MPFLMLLMMLPVWGLIGMAIVIAWLRSRVPIDRTQPVVAPVLSVCALVGVPMGLAYVAIVACIDPAVLPEASAGWGLGLVLTAWASLVVGALIRRIGSRAQRRSTLAMASPTLLMLAGLWLAAILDGDMYSLMAAWIAPAFAIPVGMAIGLAAVFRTLPALAPEAGANRCRTCGYARDGLPEATTCPECGAAWEPAR